MFEKSFIDDLREICPILDPKAVMILSNDGKTRVALGLDTASLQAPMLMQMNYRVLLLDHTFVVAPQHILISSIYGVCDIDRKGALTYLGDTLSVSVVGNTIRHQRSVMHTHYGSSSDCS